MEEKKEVKKEKSGGATFWPRETERPKYKPFSEFVKYVVIHYTRAPFLSALATYLLFPKYMRVVKHLRRNKWSEAGIFTLLTSACHAGTFATVAGFFFVVGDKLKLLEKYRLDLGKAQEPSEKLIAETLKEMFLSLLLIGPLGTRLMSGKVKASGLLDSHAKLPGLLELTRQFALATAFNDFFFYWAHRAFHSKELYGAVHKKHHRYLSAKSIAAEFAHPLEGLLANLIPTMGGVLLFPRHPLVVCVWLIARLAQTYEGHSNFYLGDTFLHKIGLTNSFDTAFHSAHHSTNKGNFGSWHMDWAFGTMDNWEKNGGLEGFLDKHMVARKQQLEQQSEQQQK